MSDTQHLPKAILDTSVLLTLFVLGITENLHLLFTEVRIPREVEREFFKSKAIDADENERYNFLASVYEKHKTWFKACNEYESDLVDLYLTEKKIDKGEAEVFAQYQALGSHHTVLIDEKEGRRIAKNKSIQHQGVLSVIAKFDILLQLCDYKTTVALLIELGVGRYKPALIDEVYYRLKTQLGLN